MAQASMTKAIQHSRGWCDLFIAEPNAIYNGAFFEIKKVGTKIYKKDGTPTTPHIGEQIEMIEQLKKRGYYAKFSIGQDELLKDVIAYLEYGR